MKIEHNWVNYSLSVLVSLLLVFATYLDTSTLMNKDTECSLQAMMVGCLRQFLKSGSSCMVLVVTEIVQLRFIFASFIAIFGELAHR